MSLVPEKRLKTWIFAGLSIGKRMYHLFPLSHARDELPIPSIVEALNCAHSEYSRADLLVAVRAMKIIER